MRAPAVVVVAAVLACGKPGERGGVSAPRVSSEFPDNPQLVHVPADTPYAFAMFKPFPASRMRGYLDAALPAWQKAASDDRRVDTWWRAVRDEVGTFDAARFEQLGFSPKGRLVVYGIGPWPVARLEIANGDRVFELVARLARRANVVLPPPRERGRHRYWIVPAGKTAVVLAIGRDELVAALVPADAVDARLALVVGDELPARHVATAAFRELARRDGFSGHGVGFVDLPRVVALAFEHDTRPWAAACRDAALAAVQRAPRLAFGYDELGASRTTFGFVLELAPDLLASVRDVATTLPGSDKLVAEPRVFGLALALHVDRARALLGRVAGTLRELGERCDDRDVVRGGDELDRVANLPLPFPASGALGGVVAMTNVATDETDKRPFNGDGYLAVYGDDVAPIVRYVSAQVPGLVIVPNGAPVELPQALAPFTGHVVATATAFAVALGEASERVAKELVAAPPQSAPAPLATLVYDYPRLAAAIGKQDASTLAMHVLFGVSTLELSVDERGLVLWTSLQVE